MHEPEELTDDYYRSLVGWKILLLLMFNPNCQYLIHVRLRVWGLLFYSVILFSIKTLGSRVYQET